MTVPLKIGVGDLIPEFLAHTEIVLGSGKAAGTVTAFFQNAFTDLFHEGFIVIVTDLHVFPPPIRILFRTHAPCGFIIAYPARRVKYENMTVLKISPESIGCFFVKIEVDKARGFV